MSRPYLCAASLSGTAFAMERSQIFVSSALLAAAGALLAFNGLPWVFGLALSIIIVISARLLGSGIRGGLILAFAFAIVYLLAASRLAGLVPHRDDLSLSRSDFVAFEGNVVGSKFKENDQGRLLTLEVACRRQLLPWPKPLAGRVLVHAGPYKLTATDEPLWGRTYIFSGRIMRPQVKLFSFEFDERRWLSLKDIYCQVSCDPPTEQTKNSGPDLASRSMAYVAALRDFVVRRHCQVLGDKRGRVLASMVLGDRAVSLSDSLRAAFNRVGLSHLLAASGLNLTIIVGAVLFVFSKSAKACVKKDKAGTLLQTLVAFACVLFFVSLAGPSPSVTRATVMCLLLLWSGLLFRRLARGAALAFALWFALLLDPLSILDVGLELSYGATFGIIFLVPIFSEALPAFPKSKIFSWLASLSSVVMSAQLAVLPIQIYYFQKLSTLVLAANIFAEPLVAPITVAGFITSFAFALSFVCAHLPFELAFFGGACDCLAALLDSGAGFLIDLLLALTQYLGASPVAYLYLAQPPVHEVVIYYLTLFIAFLIAQRRPRIGALLALFAGFTLTVLAFLNSAFVEVFIAKNTVVVVSPWRDSLAICLPVQCPYIQDGKPLEDSRRCGASGNLPAYSRNFLQAYLRSLAGRSLSVPVSAFVSEAVTNDKSLSLLQLSTFSGRNLSPLRLEAAAISSGIIGAKLVTSAPPAALDIEAVQNVRLLKLKTWGVLWLWLGLSSNQPGTISGAMLKAPPLFSTRGF